MGFGRINGEFQCVKLDGTSIDYTQPAICNDYYIVKSGYRKIAGNTCINGI
jgi:hypothetical protein